MRMAFDVENRKEGELIKRALDDPATRALVKVIGALLPLSSGGRRRVLNYVQDRLDEEAGNGSDV